MPDETICGYAVHPAAELLPMMSDASLAELADDIKANGQEQPVVVYNGLLLDGRNRLKACALAGVSPKIREWEGDDPVRWVLSLNFHRRHLTDSQKSIVGARAAEFLADRVSQRAEEEVSEPEAEPASEVLEATEAVESNEATESTEASEADEPTEAAATVAAPAEPPPKKISQREKAAKKLSQREIQRQATKSAAALVNVSPQAIARGRKLIEKAVPELVGAVNRGTVSLSQAARVAKLDSSQQRDLAARGDEAFVEEAARIQKGSASARPSTTKVLADLDRLCSEFAIQKIADGEWSVEGRLKETDEAVSQRAETLKEVMTNAWMQAQGTDGNSEPSTAE